MIDQISTKEDFAKFLKMLSVDFKDNNVEWENIELHRYFEAMERFLYDSSERSLNEIDMSPSWRLFAKIMLAASTYE